MYLFNLWIDVSISNMLFNRWIPIELSVVWMTKTDIFRGKNIFTEQFMFLFYSVQVNYKVFQYKSCLQKLNREKKMPYKQCSKGLHPQIHRLISLLKIIKQFATKMFKDTVFTKDIKSFNDIIVIRSHTYLFQFLEMVTYLIL